MQKPKTCPGSQTANHKAPEPKRGNRTTHHKDNPATLASNNPGPGPGIKARQQPGPHRRRTARQRASDQDATAARHRPTEPSPPPQGAAAPLSELAEVVPTCDPSRPDGG